MTDQSGWHGQRYSVARGLLLIARQRHGQASTLAHATQFSPPYRFIVPLRLLLKSVSKSRCASAIARVASVATAPSEVTFVTADNSFAASAIFSPLSTSARRARVSTGDNPRFTIMYPPFPSLCRVTEFALSPIFCTSA